MTRKVRTIGKGLMVPEPDDPRWEKGYREVKGFYLGSPTTYKYPCLFIRSLAFISVDLEDGAWVLIGGRRVRGFRAWKYGIDVVSAWEKRQAKETLEAQRQVAWKIVLDE